MHRLIRDIACRSFLFPFALAAGLLLACGAGDETASNGGDPAAESAAINTENAETYDLKIHFRGLVGYVPVQGGGTAKVGETADALWGLLVNAQSGVGPCAEQGPAWSEDKSYMHHFPRLRFTASQATGSDVDDGEMDLTRMHLEIRNPGLTSKGVTLAGDPATPCSQQNAETVDCVADIREVAPHLASICDGCLEEPGENQTVPDVVAARVKISDGTLLPTALEKNDTGDTLVMSFADDGHFVEVDGESFWEWNQKEEQQEAKSPISDEEVVTVEGLSGPVELILTSLDDPTRTQTITLQPNGAGTVEIEVLNQTQSVLNGQGHAAPPEPYLGREFRWYYKLSQRLQEADFDCKSEALPSLVVEREANTRPICPRSIFDV